MERRFAPGLRLYPLLFCATLAAYLPAVKAGFIWNDSDYVTKPALQSVEGLGRIWFDVGATQQYYPLLHSAFWIEHRLWGDATMGYHLVNILLHATSACLLYLVLRRLFKAGSAAPALAAFLFALHPVYVESVAWISEQKNTLSTVFYLLAALAYLRFAENQPMQSHAKAQRREEINSNGFLRAFAPLRETGLGLYVLSLGLFIMALLSKTVTATLPGALLVVLWWQRGRLSWRRDVAPLVPWFAVGAASGLFSAWVERTYVGAHGSDFNLGALERVLLAGRAAWFYLGKLVWPADLIFIYQRWDVSSAAPGQYLCPIGVVAVLAALWFIRKRTRAPLAAALFFLGSLFPVSGFFNLYAFIYSYVADHWQYLPSIGIITLAAGGWEIGKAKAEKGKSEAAIYVFRLLPVFTLATLGILTWLQSGMYNDIETFYRETIRKNPGCWMAENNLGIILERAGRLNEALVHYDRALQIQPSARACYNLGVILRRQGKPDEAMAQFERALRLDPNFADARNNLGGTLGDLGRSAEAIAQFELALKIDPNSVGARQNIGIALAQEGRYDEAVAQLREALRLAPDFAECHANLGAILRREGRNPEAIAELQRAVQLKPGLTGAHVILGSTLAVEKRYDEAAVQFREALQLDPNAAEVHDFLGVTLCDLGRIEEARAEFTSALRINPNFTNARDNLERLPPQNQ
jgi:protein O-mannosyl-transferase